MTKRNKRLKKGIESITETIEEHKIKREEALESGKIEAVDYLEKEIKSLIERKKNREDKLKK